jgi:hypothetical protein
MYEEESKFLLSVENRNNESNNRDLFTDSECDELRNKFPGLPEEYLSYLKEIGANSAREDQYMIYWNPALSHEDERFSWYDNKNKSYLVIGDDFSGNLYALDIESSFSPVLLDHECMEEFPHKGTIKSFFREMMLLDEDGSDQRIP